MKTLLRMEAVVDLNAAAATSASIFKAPGAGYVDVAACFVRFEEAVAAGGFSTTAGVASLEVGGVEVATWSTTVAPAVGRAIGDVAMATADAVYADKAVTFASGATIEVKTKTQGVGGTVTGTVRFWIPVEFNLG
jgi:hypothetical protein